jgi:hypothetical protein
MAERTQGSTYSMFPTRAELSSRASSWIRFLRQYGPVPQNENMYDEFIRRSAQRAGIDPLSFDLPASDEVLSSLTGPMPTSVVLTGTAGDGKTHLCRQVWESVGGDLDVWQSPEPYLCIPLASRSVDQGGSDGHPPMLHIIRDLSAWVPQRGGRWDTAKEELLKRFSASLFVQQSSPTEVFLIAGNAAVERF